MKRWKTYSVVLLTGIIAIAGLLTACQEEYKRYGLDPKMPTLVTVWHYYNSSQKTAFDELVDEFNRTEGKEKGIIVKAYSQGSPTSLEESMRESAQKKVGAEEVPNIFSTYVDLANEIDDTVGLAVIEDYMTQEELSLYLPNLIEEGRLVDGEHLKILPIAKSTEIMMINTTDWKKFANDTGAALEDIQTWEGLQKTAEQYYQYTDAMTPEPNDGKALFGRDALANYMLLGSKQLGNEMIQSNGQIKVEKEIVRKLWDNYYLPYIKGYYVKKGRFVTDDMKTGDIIVMAASSTSVKFFPKEVARVDEDPYPIEGIALPEPYFEGTNPICVQQGAGMAVTKSDSAHEYASVNFLKWMTESRRNLKFALATSYLPVTIDANSAETWEILEQEGELDVADEVKQTMTVASEQMMNTPAYLSTPVENGVEVRRILENSMAEKAMSDRETIKNALDQGADRDELLKNYETEEYFEQWFQEFEQSLMALTEKAER